MAPSNASWHMMLIISHSKALKSSPSTYGFSLLREQFRLQWAKYQGLFIDTIAEKASLFASERNSFLLRGGVHVERSTIDNPGIHSLQSLWPGFNPGELADEIQDRADRRGLCFRSQVDRVPFSVPVNGKGRRSLFGIGKPREYLCRGRLQHLVEARAKPNGRSIHLEF